jgi:hypothetical protein
MLKRRTLFVVGAGASFEFELPIGKKLASTIKGKMDLAFDHMSRNTGTGVVYTFNPSVP